MRRPRNSALQIILGVLLWYLWLLGSSHHLAVAFGVTTNGRHKKECVFGRRGLSTTSLIFSLKQQQAWPSFQKHTATTMRTPLIMAASSPSSAVASTTSTLVIGDLVGSGSYGTVHKCHLRSDDNDDDDETVIICKRAWTLDELRQLPRNNDNEIEENNNDETYFKERAQRCQYYFHVERHVYVKMSSSQQETTTIPSYKGTLPDEDGREWMVFDLIAQEQDNSNSTPTTPARTLDDVIKMDWSDQHKDQQDQHHHLYMVQRELGLSDDATFGDTLDVVFASLLDGLAFCHAHNIVHRDVKPGNLLLDASTHSLRLIDFGSAADMEPNNNNNNGLLNNIFGKQRVGMEDESRVAVSPIYSAPEVFIQPERAPLEFDVFSAGLVFCQLLLNYLDERTDAGFHQQLEDANYDLDVWLSRELSSKVRPAGLEDALLYLAERPGLWRLLGEMFRRDPEERVSSLQAKDRFEAILSTSVVEDIAAADGSFFESVVAAAETCEVPLAEAEEAAVMARLPRPLHYVATFKRNLSLGLILSEAGQEDEDEQQEDDVTRQKWLDATADARPGEVFVRGVVKMGQADQMGIFEVGDRLQGVGELPLAEGGFEKVLDMLERQPRSSKNVKLHFDRQSVGASQLEKTAPHLVRVVQQGAWSSKGRRKTQEDSFVLHELHSDENDDDAILIAGVFDGHGGTGASKTASQILPSLFSLSREDGTTDLEKSLLEAWDTTCRTYRDGCDEMGTTCVAEYDPREGILLANTGSDDLVAGTTAAVVAMSTETEEMTVLNCGDSRTVLVGKPRGSSSAGSSVVHFSSRDHAPSCEQEAERLRIGKEQDGLDYSLPQCSLSRWWLSVGDYQYAVSRSLEGTYATSKGIVSEADISRINISEMLSEREKGVVVIASDGLFEVMDNEQVGRELLILRETGWSAGDAAKGLCSLALEKGTSDNVSVVVIYLE